MRYLGFSVHANHIIAKEATITAIHDLTIPRNINDEGSYQGQAWFLIDFTGKIKTKWTGEIRISFPTIAYILCTPLTLLKNFIMHFQVRCNVYTIRVQALLFQAWMHNNMEEEKWWSERGKGVTTDDWWKCKE